MTIARAARRRPYTPDRKHAGVIPIENVEITPPARRIERGITMNLKNSNRPNIILIITDQQRFDSFAFTPNLDRMKAEGACCTNVFCAAPSCVPSRFSFFNGLYPHGGNVYTNGHGWTHSWVESLRGAGYCCVNAGKMHTVPYDADCGFHQRFVVENKDRPRQNIERRLFDEWDKFLLFNGQEKPGRDSYKKNYPSYEEALGAYEWPLEERFHPDVFTGNMALKIIGEYEPEPDRPLFLQIGFPGPHPPYDPPQRYIDMYADAELPLPNVTEEELRCQPPVHDIYRTEMITGNHDAIRWQKRPSRGALQRLRRHYAANMTLIDEKVGQIMDALQEKGLLENSVVMFTSDHGDCTGDHGHIQKWTMYDEILRVPMIIRAPGRIKPGTKHTALAQQMDAADLLLDYAQIKKPAWDAEPLDLAGNTGRKYIFAEHGRDNVWHGADFMVAARSERHKIVLYRGETRGELYDLASDPGEKTNLWDEPEAEKIKIEMTEVVRQFNPESVF